MHSEICRVIWTVDPDMGFKGAKGFSISGVDDNCSEISMPFSGPRTVARYAKAFERAGYTVLHEGHTILIERGAAR